MGTINPTDTPCPKPTPSIYELSLRAVRESAPDYDLNDPRIAPLTCNVSVYPDLAANTDEFLAKVGFNENKT